MEDTTQILQIVARLGALFCAAAYVYGYIIRSRGDRRWHTASLLCSGLALANFSVVLPWVAKAGGTLNSAMVVVFLLLSVACQAYTAFRGRRGDRRDEAGAFNRRTSDKSESVGNQPAAA